MRRSFNRRWMVDKNPRFIFKNASETEYEWTFILPKIIYQLECFYIF